MHLVDHHEASVGGLHKIARVDQTQADPAIALNAEKTLVVYTWSYVPTDTAHAGLWTLAP